MKAVTRQTFIAGLAVTAFSLASGAALAQGSAKPGSPAPAFAIVDIDGKTRKLSDYAGKTVILEWTNHDCPYVRKHYNSATMQTLQKDMAKEGIVWLLSLTNPASAIVKAVKLVFDLVMFLVERFQQAAVLGMTTLAAGQLAEFGLHVLQVADARGDAVQMLTHHLVGAGAGALGVGGKVQQAADLLQTEAKFAAAADKAQAPHVLFLIVAIAGGAALGFR